MSYTVSRPMRAFALFAAALFPCVAFAQSDEPIPYSDEIVEEKEPPPLRELPRWSEPSDSRRRDERDDREERPQFGGEELSREPTPYSRGVPTEDEAPIPYGFEDEPLYEAPPRAGEKLRSYAAADDPNTGVGVQLFGGVALLDSSHAAGVNTRPTWGARLTWEFGRVLFSDFLLRDALFVDGAWSYVGFRDGTTAVFGDSNLHYFSLAPAWTVFFDAEKTFGVYAQAGGGAAYQFSSFHVLGGETPVGGWAPLIQYGVGLRGRPLLGGAGSLRLTFRVELTRYRRGYLDDTVIAGSFGGGF